MKIKNNYKSVVCLGSFNPSILTPRFLHNVCGFKFDVKPTGQNTPVASNIQFANTHFLAEMEKFQVIEHEPKDWADAAIITFFERYMEMLSYTPISVCGVNFNFSLSDYDTSSIKTTFNESENLLSKLKTAQMVVDKKEVMKSDGLEDWLSYNVTYEGAENEVRRVNVQKNGPQSVVINFNYEIKGLEKDRGRIKILKEHFSAFVSEKERLLNELFGVVRQCQG